MASVKKIIQQLRTKLLDLSRRNKLISFKHSERSRRQLRFVGTTFGDVFDKLEGDKSLELLPLPLPDSEQEDATLGLHFIRPMLPVP